MAAGDAGASGTRAWRANGRVATLRLTMTAPLESGPVAPAPRRFSEELAFLEATFALRAVTLREILAVLHGRAYLMLILLLCLPFVVPVSVPGMSTPLGAVIALIAASFVAGRTPWLPARLLDVTLPLGFLGKIIRFARRLVRWLEKFLRPRLPGMFGRPAWPRMHALVMVGGALLLALPLPIPLTNMVPGWAIFLVAAGLLERDGAFVLAGYAMLAVSFAYFALLGESIRHSFHWLMQWLGPG